VRHKNAMAIKINATGDCLTKASVVSSTAINLTLTCWVYVTIADQSGLNFIILQNADSSNRIWLALSVGQVQIGLAIGGLTTTAQTSADIPLNQWVFCAAVFGSSTDRRAYWNGANGVSMVVTEKTVTGLTQTNIGARWNGTAWAGTGNFQIAYPAIYNHAFATGAETIQVYKGLSQRAFRQQYLKSYTPMSGPIGTTEVDLCGTPWTVNGTPTKATVGNPRVVRP
jgi:Concanavalin A-like lectin/glucanases superfamily